MRTYTVFTMHAGRQRWQYHGDSKPGTLAATAAAALAAHWPRDSRIHGRRRRGKGWVYTIRLYDTNNIGFFEYLLLAPVKESATITPSTCKPLRGKHDYHNKD